MESPDKALRKSQSPDRRRSDRCAEAVSDAARNAKKQTDPGTRRPEEERERERERERAGERDRFIREMTLCMRYLSE